MTKKDYELIVTVLNGGKPVFVLGGDRAAKQALYDGAIDQWSDTIQEFAKQLENENPRFNRDIFIKACTA